MEEGNITAFEYSDREEDKLTILDHSSIQECYSRVVVNVLEEVRVICGIWVIWFRGKDGLILEVYFVIHIIYFCYLDFFLILFY